MTGRNFLPSERRPPAIPGLLEELLSEFVQIFTPDDPSMRTFRLLINDIELVLLEHLDGRARCFYKKIIFARCEPKQLQTLL